jgi:hypothetical protein
MVPRSQSSFPQQNLVLKTQPKPAILVGTPTPTPKPSLTPPAIVIQQPFKEAFQNVSANSPVTPVPLSALSKNHLSTQPLPKNNQKIATPKNVNDLKSALASIMATNAGEKPLPKKEILNENPRVEVPKEVLENILKVN